MGLRRRLSNLPAVATTAFAMGLLLASACGCPTSPTTSTSMRIEPASVQVAAGAQRQFCGSGPASPYFWSVTSGGGTVAVTTEFCATLTAGTTPGQYSVTVRSASAAATATVTIVAAQ